MIHKLKSLFLKPKQTEISMTRLMELVALVKKLLVALADARAEIISLKSELLAMEIQATADGKTIDELMALGMKALDEGGSTGDVVG